MVHLVPFPTPFPLLNSVMEESVTLQHLIGTRTSLWLSEAKEALLWGKKVDTAANKKKDLGFFYLRNASFNPLPFFSRTCLKSFVCISLAREKSATMLIVTLLTPGRLLSSNARHHRDRQSFHQKRHGLVQRISFHEDA